MSDYLKLDEVAKLYGVSKSTVLQEVKKQNLKAIKFSQQVLIPKENHWNIDPTYKCRGKRIKKVKPDQTQTQTLTPPFVENGITGNEVPQDIEIKN